MANVQTFWNHTGAKIDPVDVRSSAFLTANAWDDIANNLGGIGKTLIEDPMSKRYLHDLNQGKDVSGYNPMVLSQDVLEKTPTIMGQLVSNNKNKLDYNVALAKENDIKANSDLYNKAMSAYARGDDATAKQLLSEYANRPMRADVSKEFMPDIFDHEMDKERLQVAKSANALGWANRADELAQRQEMLDLAKDYAMYQDYKGTYGTALDSLAVATKDPYSPVAQFIKNPNSVNSAKLKKWLVNQDFYQKLDKSSQNNLYNNVFSINNAGSFGNQIQTYTKLRNNANLYGTLKSLTTDPVKQSEVGANNTGVTGY